MKRPIYSDKFPKPADITPRKGNNSAGKHELSFHRRQRAGKKKARFVVQARKSTAQQQRLRRSLVAQHTAARYDRERKYRRDLRAALEAEACAVQGMTLPSYLRDE